MAHQSRNDAKCDLKPTQHAHEVAFCMPQFPVDEHETALGAVVDEEAHGAPRS